jgi:diadenosine tetraphosphate (Ap4A) HIT family hydrolase
MGVANLVDLPRRISLPVACFFCDRLGSPRSFPGGVIYEDAWFHASCWTRDGERPYLGQIVVQAKRHIPSLGELSPDEGTALGPLVQRLANALQRIVHPELVYLECYMEGVRHVHFFLTPRYGGTPPEFWRLNVTEWPKAPHPDPAEMDALGDRLRAILSEPARP